MKALTPDRFVRGDYVNTEYRATPLEGTAPDDLLTPAYWVHEARTLRRFDRIVAVPDDEAWYAEYIVLETGTGFVRTGILFQVELNQDSVQLPDDSPVEVLFKGPHLKYVVMRKADKMILHDKMLKAEAENWARDYERRVAA